jgi:hypothetical protein
VSAGYLTYERGRKMRRDGLPCPPKPPETGDGLGPASLLWTGYRVEMAMDYMRRKKVAEMLNMPAPEWRE